jgi:molybdate-binding protein
LLGVGLIVDILIADWFKFDDLLTLAATVDADDADTGKDCARYLAELDKKFIRITEESVYYF